MWSFLQGKCIQHKTFWMWLKWSSRIIKHRFPWVCSVFMKVFQLPRKKDHNWPWHIDERWRAYLRGGGILENWNLLLNNTSTHIGYRCLHLTFQCFSPFCESAPHQQHHYRHLIIPIMLLNYERVTPTMTFEAKPPKIPPCSLFFTLELCSPPAARIRAHVSRRRDCW